MYRKKTLQFEQNAAEWEKDNIPFESDYWQHFLIC